MFLVAVAPGSWEIFASLSLGAMFALPIPLFLFLGDALAEDVFGAARPEPLPIRNAVLISPHCVDR
jgi:hypothetical protein